MVLGVYIESFDNCIGLELVCISYSNHWGSGLVSVFERTDLT